MKIHIFTKGDPSVGINGDSAVINFPYRENENDFGMETEDMKKALTELFSEIFDEKAYVLFDSELKEHEDQENQDYERFDGME